MPAATHAATSGSKQGDLDGFARAQAVPAAMPVASCSSTVCGLAESTASARNTKPGTEQGPQVDRRGRSTSQAEPTRDGQRRGQPPGPASLAQRGAQVQARLACSDKLLVPGSPGDQSLADLMADSIKPIRLCGYHLLSIVLY
jgi:hypothetical protein